MQAVTGVIGVPPVNGVLPQAPMHTKSLVTLKQMLVERNERKKARVDLSPADPAKVPAGTTIVRDGKTNGESSSASQRVSSGASKLERV